MVTFIDSTGEVVEQAQIEAEITRRGGRGMLIEACVRDESFVLGYDMGDRNRTPLQQQLGEMIERDPSLHVMPLGWKAA